MNSFFSEKSKIEQAKISPKAFEKLYLAYMPKVYAYIASRTNNIQEAEDLTSEVWLKIIKKIDNFNTRHENSFSAWIFTITKHHLIDYYRKNNNSPIPCIDLEKTLSNSFNMDQKLDNTLLEKKFKEILLTLPSKQAESIRLKYFGGLRNKEIATILGISEKTVASNLTRALDKIRQSNFLQ